MFDPSLSVVVNQSHTHPTYYKAEPTKNALREAIVEQDIGPGGASWTPQISLRNGSNHGDLEWLNGGGVLQKCHMSNGKSKIYIKNKKIEAGDERHSSNTLTLSNTAIAYRASTVETVGVHLSRDLTAGPTVYNDLLYMVRAVRLELTRLFSLRILSPLRLPIPPCSPSRMNAS